MNGCVLGSLWISLPVPSLIIDGSNRITEINPAGEAFLNFSAKLLRGVPIWDRINVDAPVAEAVLKIRETQSAIFINTVAVGSSERSPSQCNVHMTPLIDQSDHILIMLEPREMSDKIGRSLQNKSAARSAIGLSEMLAHEIKNPLAGITGAAQLLSMNLSREDAELTDLIVEESRRIVKLLEQVEQFGNMRPPIRKSVNIHDVLNRALKSATVGFASAMAVHEEFDPSLPPTFADADQLLQVFLNLLKNSSEAAGSAGGKIWVRTFYELSLRIERADGTRADAPLQIEVIDDGPGLPSDLSDQVFEPFVSGRENGTGLGLALVSKIISEHDGWLTVNSVPGYTVFRLSLPLAPKS